MINLNSQKQICSPEQNDGQALQPVVGNFDTLVEATSEEKAPLWWDKNTCSCGISCIFSVYLVDCSWIRIGLAKSVHHFLIQFV